MSLSNDEGTLKLLHVKLRKDIEEAFGAFQAKLVKLDASILDRFSTCREERELPEQTIEFNINHLIKLKTHINTLVSINRLPVELFTYIIRLAYLPLNESKHPYVSYTWICRYWRSVLVQTPDFWTFIRSVNHLPMKLFDHEILRRSKSAQLDVMATVRLGPLNSAYEIFLAKESNRIRNLWIISQDVDTIRTVFSDKRFPSLRGFVHDALEISAFNTIIPLLPTLSASDHLETFQCALTSQSFFSHVRDQLAPIFSRIRNLNILVYDPTILQALLDMLHNNVKLKDLQIKIYGLHDASMIPTGRTSLPGLQLLSINDAHIMEYLQIPRLSSLIVLSYSLADFDLVQPALKTFDLSSIRYLYILEYSYSQNLTENHSILGSKQRRHLESLFSTNTDYFNDVSLSPNDPYIMNMDCSVKEVLSVEDFLSEIHPRDCFELQFGGYIFNEALRQALPLIIPRLTSLTEIYIFSRTLRPSNGNLRLEEFLTLLPPSVERIIVKKGDDLLDLIRLLSNTSICPRLKQLHFKGSKNVPQDLVDYAENVGKMLTECVRLRYNACANQLQHIALGNCPPLPGVWLEELRKLGTKVVTQKR